MTLPTLQSWPDFDEEGAELCGATVLGQNGEPVAIVLVGEYHDAFLRLALAASELLHALQLARDHLEVCNGEGEEDEALERINAAIAKAQGEQSNG